MPSTFKNIKFGRRKSQGNSLDEENVGAPPTGFRVLPREETYRKSVGSVLELRRAATYNPSLPSSVEDDSGSSKRGSNSSASTVPRLHIFDHASSQSSWMSSIQSPTEATKKEQTLSPHLLELDDDDFESGWGDIFNLERRESPSPADHSTAQSAAKSVVSKTNTVLANPPKVFSQPDRKSNPSPPMNYALRREMTASPPPTWEKRSSRDGLMSSIELNYDSSPTRDRTPPPPPPKHSVPTKPVPHSTYHQLDESSRIPDEPLHHLNSLRSQNSFTQSGANEDADALMVRESVRAMRASTFSGLQAYNSSPLGQDEMTTSRSSTYSPPDSRPLNSSDVSLKTTSSSSSSLRHHHQTPTKSGLQASADESFRSTPRAFHTNAGFKDDEEVEEDDIFDEGIVQAIQHANNRSMLGLPERPPVQAGNPAPSGKKVMSMAEFDAQRANLRYAARISAGQDSDSDDGYEDDDDDPIIQAQKRRMEQQREAQHAVWRQRMKKEIGDQSSLPPRPDSAKVNQSAPSITFNGPSMHLDDEDDDIPLGILQAHNFPNGSKSPEPRMSQSSYVGVQTSAGNATNAGQRASQLPPFARRLPEDPYFGAADLSTSTNRESLNFKSHPHSVYGGPGVRAGPPPGVSPVPGIPPGGLVNVIAQEESMRSHRRGSSNAFGGAMPYNMPGMGNVSSHVATPSSQGDDALRHQQMLELMQQNSLMMKEMMDLRTQMQYLHMGGMPMAGLPAPTISGYDQSSRRSITPNTMYSRAMSFVGPAPNTAFVQQQATAGAGARSVMSMPLDPHPNSHSPPRGYTPSLAPSERSNVGQPSRYKPVNFGDGASTITPGGSPRGFLSPRPTMALSTSPQEGKKSGFLNARIHTSGRKSFSAPSVADEDEEQWGAKKSRR